MIGTVVIESFSADASIVAPGSAVTLSWEVGEFDTLEINNGVGDVAPQTNGGAGSVLYPGGGGASDSAEPARIPQEAVFAARGEIARIQVSDAVERYIADLVYATRTPEKYSEDLDRWIPESCF